MRLQIFFTFVLFNIILLLSLNTKQSFSFLRKPYTRWTHKANVNLNARDSTISNGEALFLTPYIENGKIAEGRNLSRVGPLPNSPNPSPVSYSGFLTVNKTVGSNMFFWFFPAMVSRDDLIVIYIKLIPIFHQ